MKIDASKTYKTRDGRQVRIYATGAGGDYPVHGATKDENHKWRQTSWTADGSYVVEAPSGLDLIEQRPRRTLNKWLNVYDDMSTIGCATREEADSHCSDRRIACLHITREFEEGEGLDEGGAE